MRRYPFQKKRLKEAINTAPKKPRNKHGFFITSVKEKQTHAKGVEAKKQAIS